MSQVNKFFVLTLLFSWLWWIPVVIWPVEMAVMMPLVLVGAFGPTIMGVVLTYRYEDAMGRREFWQRCFQLSRIPGRWWLLIVLLFPLMAALTAVVDTLLGGTGLSLDTDTLFDPLKLAGFIVLMILGGPLAEELGWRGFALDRLQAKHSALVASLFLGVVWVLWHLPLFYMEGTSQGALGFPSWGFAMWATQVLALAIIYTWVYNHTGRSILSAFLLHFFGNSTFTLMAGVGGKLPVQTEVISCVVHVVAAIAVVLYFGGKTLVRDKPV